jgi:hypothetical protein
VLADTLQDDPADNAPDPDPAPGGGSDGGGCDGGGPADGAGEAVAPRTRGQKMVDCLLDLVLRPGESEVPPVQVLLTVAASLGTLLGGDQPGEIDGQPVPAALVRDSLAAATEAQRGWLADLLAATAGGGLADRPRIALLDALAGTLLARTDLPELRRTATCGASSCRRRPAACTHDLTGRPGLGPPPASEGYRPGAGLDRHVRARDRRCRFPSSRHRVPEGGELDHHTRYPDGPTAETNLAGYCTTDHRCKHQAPGWRFDLAADATLTVTTPTGLTASTTPPPY